MIKTKINALFSFGLQCLESDIVSSRELYKHRVDKLLERIHNQRTGWVVEHFAAGRLYNIKGEKYCIIKNVQNCFANRNKIV